MKNIYFTFIMVSAISLPAVADNSQVGTITRIEGAVVLLHTPSQNINTEDGAGKEKDNDAWVKYEGKYYRHRLAQVGDRLEKGNVLQTRLNGKARVVYDNGDQFNVGNGTAYSIIWKDDDSDSKTASTKVNLTYGSLRGVIQKGGPRSRLNVRTRSATMGVRGTDFFIRDKGFGKGTEVSVIRGKVEVKKVETVANQVVESKAVQVDTGKKAEVLSQSEVKATTVESKPVESSASQGATAATKASTPLTTAVEIQVSTLDKGNLVEIHHESFVKAEISKVDDASASTSMQEKVANLEKQAVASTLKDMKAENPQLVASLQGKNLQDAQLLNTVVVKEMFKSAPPSEDKDKAHLQESDFDSLGDDAYQRYFK